MFIGRFDNLFPSVQMKWSVKLSVSIYIISHWAFAYRFFARTIRLFEVLNPLLLSDVCNRCYARCNLFRFFFAFSLMIMIRVDVEHFYWTFWQSLLMRSSKGRIHEIINKAIRVDLHHSVFTTWSFVRTIRLFGLLNTIFLSNACVSNVNLHFHV